MTLAGEGLAWRWPQNELRLGGTATIGGGGLPDAQIAFRRATDGSVSGQAQIARYMADGASLSLAPVGFRLSPSGAGSAATRLTLSGPLADGRIEGLDLPIDARWTGSGAMTISPGCTPVAWQRLTVSALTLGPERLTLCPEDAALVTVAGGRVGGGVRLGATQLEGRIGSTPLQLAFAGGRAGLARQDFALTGVATRLGEGDRMTRIDAATLDGRRSNGAVAGQFAGGAGQIGQVPLLLSQAAGDWRFADGRLTLGGGLQVADAQVATPRFNPLTSDDVALALVGNAITATGTLRTPRDRSVVATVDIAHDLSSGTGRAGLDVPGITFVPRGLQPDALTPLTFGVIAAVSGSVSGRGDIAWTPEGVTSTGRFATQGTDLAAAFGPATGISGEIAFTDLLGLKTAPGQVATIAQVNPGYRGGKRRRPLPADRRAARAGGGRPLAICRRRAGAGTHRARFQRRSGTADDLPRDRGRDSAAFLQQFDFGNLNATGTFDGVLPMIFDENGGRIENGRLTARSGGSIAYLGELSDRDLGTWGNIAFQALRALEYRSLDRR